MRGCFFLLGFGVLQLRCLSSYDSEVESVWGDEFCRYIYGGRFGAVQIVPAGQAFADVRRTLVR